MFSQENECFCDFSENPEHLFFFHFLLVCFLVLFMFFHVLLMFVSCFFHALFLSPRALLFKKMLIFPRKTSIFCRASNARPFVFHHLFSETFSFVGSCFYCNFDVFEMIRGAFFSCFLMFF